MAILDNRRLGFIGAGNMAEAIVRGALKAGLFTPAAVFASDLSPERRALFERELGIATFTKNSALLERADILLLCVKPQQADAVLNELASELDAQRHLLLSICAGIKTERIERRLPAQARVIRAMPNTPLLVGLGASCLCAGKYAQEHDLLQAEAILGAAGLVMRVIESRMDAVTGLSGSGPAYLFYLVEAMVAAGVAEGFTQGEALTLAARTCLGAAKMLEETQLDPAELRRRVTSPNGTTQAAIELLDARSARETLIAAVRRATERSRELGH